MICYIILLWFTHQLISSIQRLVQSMPQKKNTLEFCKPLSQLQYYLCLRATPLRIFIVNTRAHVINSSRHKGDRNRVYCVCVCVCSRCLCAARMVWFICGGRGLPHSKVRPAACEFPVRLIGMCVQSIVLQGTTFSPCIAAALASPLICSCA